MRTLLPCLLLALLSVSLVVGSCGLVEDNAGKTETDSSYVRATLNGTEKWNGILRSYLSKGGGQRWLTISMGKTQEPQHLYTEKLVFVAMFGGADTYPLVEIDRGWEETGASYYELAGDALLATYHATDDTSANQLTVTSYDSTTGIMEGTFRTTVVVDSADRVDEPGEPPRRRPDTLRFTDGEFRVKVEDRRDE